MGAKKFKVGDYVEVLPGKGNAGVEDGEQGFVVTASNPSTLEVIFPACEVLLWHESHWRVTENGLKLICRFQPIKVIGGQAHAASSEEHLN